MSDQDRIDCTIVLNGLQSAVNIGRVIRTCEVFQVKVGVYDPTGVMQDAEKNKVISDFACGAVERTDLVDVGDLSDIEHVKSLKKRGRLIATCVGQDAIDLPNFTFQPGDMVVIGNEYDGLSQEFIDVADAKLFIPMPEVWVPKPKSFYPIDPSRQEEVAQNGLANLSASTSANIISYNIYLQMRYGRK